MTMMTIQRRKENSFSIFALIIILTIITILLFIFPFKKLGNYILNSSSIDDYDQDYYYNSQLRINKQIVNQFPSSSSSISSNFTFSSLKSIIRCEDSSETCLFNNIYLFYNIFKTRWEFHLYNVSIATFDEDSHSPSNDNSSNNNKNSSLLDTIMTLGIGSPASYAYIDYWTFSDNQSLSANHKHRIESIQMEYPERTLIPIFIRNDVSFMNLSCCPLSNSFHSDSHSPCPLSNSCLSFGGFTILSSLLWSKNLFRIVYAAASMLFTLNEWTFIDNNFESNSNSSFKLNILLGDSMFNPGIGGLITALFQAKIYFLDELSKSKIYHFESLIIGNSKKSLLQELQVMKEGGEITFTMRAAVFKKTGQMIRDHLLKHVNHNIHSNFPSSFPIPFPLDFIEKGIGNENEKGIGNENKNEKGIGNEKGKREKKNHFNHKKRILVIRKDGKRSIKNMENFIKSFNLHPIILEDYPLPIQVLIMTRIDLMVSVHGAGLTHMFWMNNGHDSFLLSNPNSHSKFSSSITFSNGIKSKVIEIFPWGFEKSIYRNLASHLDITYMSWNQPRSMEMLPELQVDWYKQSSKDLWRNQNVTIDLDEFRMTMDFLDFVSPSLNVNSSLNSSLNVNSNSSLNSNSHLGNRFNLGNEKFLIYMPWEQLNNQLLELKCACATAIFLNRTLVLPPVGFRKNREFSNNFNNSSLQFPSFNSLFEDGNHRIIYSPRFYEWRPITRYFSMEMIQKLPCRTVPFLAFVQWKKYIKMLVLRHLFLGRFLTKLQLEEYYWNVASIQYDHISILSPHHQNLGIYLSLPNQIIGLLERFKDKQVLAMGSMYWFYTFKTELDYPLTRYWDLMNDPLYRQIASAMSNYHSDLIYIKDLMMEIIKMEMIKRNQRELEFQFQFKTLSLVSIHLRRGDYGEKCYEVHGRIQENSCWQPWWYLVKILRKSFIRNKKRKETIIKGNDQSNPFLCLFIATNHFQIEEFIWNLQNGTFWFDSIFTLPLLISQFKREWERRNGDLEGNEMKREKIQIDKNNEKNQNDNDNKRAMIILNHIDPNDLAIIDQLIAIESKIFIGNYFSSFTRTIAEQRSLLNRTSEFF